MRHALVTDDRDGGDDSCGGNDAAFGDDRVGYDACTSGADSDSCVTALTVVPVGMPVGRRVLRRGQLGRQHLRPWDRE